MFIKLVRQRIRSKTAAIAQVIQNPGRLDLSSIQQPANTLCRGITRDELDQMLLTNQVQTFTRPTDLPVGECGYAEQVVCGQGALLSLSEDIHTANQYGANRSYVPSDGAIIIMAKPPFSVKISEHVRLCPQLTSKYIEKYMKMMTGGSFLGNGAQSVSVPDLTGLTIYANETSAVVGRHNGVDFSGALDVNNNVYSITHVVGAGRGFFCKTGLVETYVNPNFSHRALSVEMTLTSDPEHLNILETEMALEGTLEKGHRLLTPDDAALIQSDEELRCYLTSPAGSNPPIILKSVPNDIYGEALVPYLHELLGASDVLGAVKKF